MLKRKLFSCLAYVVFAASLFATACSGRKTQQESVELKKIVIAEPLHSIGYLPLYIGQQEGFFAEEGLDVEVIQATGGSHVAGFEILFCHKASIYFSRRSMRYA